MPQAICFKCPWAIAVEAAGTAIALQMFAGGGQPVTFQFAAIIFGSTFIGSQVFNTAGDPVITVILSAISYYVGARFGDVPLSVGHLALFVGIIAAWNFYLQQGLGKYVYRARDEYDFLIEDARNFVGDVKHYF